MFLITLSTTFCCILFGLSQPSPVESYVPFMPNVLKVFLENGQTKSFKYDNKTTVKVSRLFASQVFFFFSFVCIRRVRLNLDRRFLYMKSAHSAFRVGRYGCLCTSH